MRLVESGNIATTTAARRVLARVMNEQGEHRGLYTYGAPDEHVHAGLLADRATAGEFANHFESALKQRLRLAEPFEPARIRPMFTRKHVFYTYHYVLRQDAHHGVRRDCFLEGTSLPDQLGFRVLPNAIQARIDASLPRIHIMDLVQRYFPPGVFEPGRQIDLAVLADAAAAAFAIPNLEGRSDDVVRARRAAVHVAGPDVASRILGDQLELSTRGVRALRLLPPEPTAVRAVRLQALLRTPVNGLEGRG